MKNFRTAVLVMVAAVLLLVCGPVWSQDLETLDKHVDIEVGIPRIYPLNDEFHDFFGDFAADDQEGTFMGGHIGVIFWLNENLGLGAQAQYIHAQGSETVEIENGIWILPIGKFDVDIEGEITIVPAVFNLYLRTTPNELFAPDTRWGIGYLYAGAGIGFYNVEWELEIEEISVKGFDVELDEKDDDQFQQFGFHVLAGANLGIGFVEARYGIVEFDDIELYDYYSIDVDTLQMVSVVLGLRI